MLFLTTAIATFLIFTPVCARDPYYYTGYSPKGKKYSGVAAVSNGGGTTVIALDGKLGKKFQGFMADHTQDIMKNTQDQIQRSFADSDRFSRNLQAKINADVQRSLASAFGGMGSFGGFDMGLGFGAGLGNLDQTINDFQNNIFSGVSRSIAQNKKLNDNLQNNVNDAIREAAKSGKLKVLRASGNGPVSVVSSSSGNGGVFVSGSTGGPSGMVVLSNTPVKINGQEYNPIDIEAVTKRRRNVIG